MVEREALPGEAVTRPPFRLQQRTKAGSEWGSCTWDRLWQLVKLSPLRNQSEAWVIRHLERGAELALITGYIVRKHPDDR